MTRLLLCLAGFHAYRRRDFGDGLSLLHCKFCGERQQ